MFFARSTSLITAFITFERCLCIAVPLKVKSIITPTRTRYIIASIFFFIGVSVVPIYYAISLGEVFVEDRNRTLYAIVYRPGGQDVEAVCFALTEFAQLSSFVLVIVFTAILIRNLLKKSRWRREAAGLGTSRGGHGAGTPAEFSSTQTITRAAEQETGAPTQADKSANRDRRVMVLVLSIACIFIACFLPSASNLVVIILLPDYNITGRYKNMFQVTGAICNTCESINSSVNIFVYYNMSSRYRAEFRRLFGKERYLSGIDGPASVVTD
ncbi:chemosensory receptor B [Elysia marginata]|uniref:Chemosensory receptor B n=1 Tax=Elysia marginata TaxID=1093978 RepID=A0AAV4IJ05_9GAST|nr:chemosensory receptor B [Elysia marginata]